MCAPYAIYGVGEVAGLRTPTPPGPPKWTLWQKFLAWVLKWLR